MIQELNGPPARIFFIDDDPNFLEGLRRTLHPMRAEWEMVFCEDPEHALDALQGAPSAVVVTDWTMHKKDGLAVCKQLQKEMIENPDLDRYVILLTGRQNSDDQVMALNGGADDFIVKPFEAQILTARIRVGLRLLAMRENLRRANRRLTELATTDPLTGALNRRQGMDVILGELSRVKRGQEDLSIVLVDLDKFKRINDTYGHIAGDAVLQQVVDALKATCRAYDAVVRWGGDELLVVCPAANPDQIREVAERFRRAIAAIQVHFGEGITISLTASLGAVTLLRGNLGDVEQLVALADASLYEIKRSGGDGVAYTRCGSPDEAAQAEEALKAYRNAVVAEAKGIAPCR